MGWYKNQMARHEAAKANPGPTLREALAENKAKADARAAETPKGKADAQIICPQCQTAGSVTTRQTKAKGSISGGKATGALLTGGISMLATGLASKHTVTQATYGWDNPMPQTSIPRPVGNLSALTMRLPVSLAHMPLPTMSAPTYRGALTPAAELACTATSKGQ